MGQTAALGEEASQLVSECREDCFTDLSARPGDVTDDSRLADRADALREHSAIAGAQASI